MSSMAFSLSIWTGSFIVISQVDVVGRQQQPLRQPWTNCTMNSFGNPRGGIWEDPVIHLTRSIKLTSSMPVMEKGGCWAMHAQNKKLNVSWNGMMGLRCKGNYRYKIGNKDTSSIGGCHNITEEPEVFISATCESPKFTIIWSRN